MQPSESHVTYRHMCFASPEIRHAFAMGSTTKPRLGVVVVAHGTEVTKGVVDDEPATGALAKLVLEATKLIQAHVGQGHDVHVIASGGKRAWTDQHSLGEVLLREIVRELSIDMFAIGAKARATIEVEGKSKDVDASAYEAIRRLKTNGVTGLTVVCALGGKAADAFRFAQCPVQVVTPPFCY